MRDLEGYCWGAVGTGCNSPDFSLFLYHHAFLHSRSSEKCVGVFDFYLIILEVMEENIKSF